MSDTIRFARLKLFFMYSLTAWYSLYNPKPGLEMLADHNEARAKRDTVAAIERIKSRRRTASVPEGKPTVNDVRSRLKAKGSTQGELG